MIISKIIIFHLDVIFSSIYDTTQIEYVTILKPLRYEEGGIGSAMCHQIWICMRTFVIRIYFHLWDSYDKYTKVPNCIQNWAFQIFKVKVDVLSQRNRKHNIYMDWKLKMFNGKVVRNMKIVEVVQYFLNLSKSKCMVI